MKLTQRPVHRLFALLAVITATALPVTLCAQTHQGKAEVRAVKGEAMFSTAGSPLMPLKVGTVLGSGATIKTAAGSMVDLFLGNSAGVVRVTENSTLTLDKLTLTDTGADTVVEVQLNLPEGTILGNVNKLSGASKYEIKVPNGVAGIRGTKYRISSSSYIVLLEGTLIFVYVPPTDPTPRPYTLIGPPAQYFSPVEGVKPAPEPLVREVSEQIERGPRFEPPGPPPGVPFRDPFVTPGVGAKPPTPRNQ
jgi:FecR protein